MFNATVQYTTTTKTVLRNSEITAASCCFRCDVTSTTPWLFHCHSRPSFMLPAHFIVTTTPDPVPGFYHRSD